MKHNVRYGISLFFVVMAFLCSLNVHAQKKTLAELQTDLVSPWLVTVEGEPRTRTLRIAGVAQKPDGTLLLEATYGFTDERQTAISASASQSGQTSTLLFDTQAGSKAVSTGMPDGSFEGTITYKNGQAKVVKIQKLSEGEFQIKVGTAQEAKAKTLIVKPAADVPEECRFWSDKWTGTWPQAGQSWLWIAGVDANCGVKFAYHGTSRTPTSFATAQIKDGVLTFGAPFCARDGTCIFKRHGDKLWVSYSNAIGGTSNTVFERAPQ